MEQERPVTAEDTDVPRRDQVRLFDDEAVRKAQHAVPLAGPKRSFPWSKSVILTAILAGLGGGVIGSVALSALHHRSGASIPATPIASTVTGIGGDHGKAADGADRSRDSNSPSEQVSAGDATIHGKSVRPPADEVKTGLTPAPADPRASLQSALADWIASTNARDINRQTQWYADKLDAFYLTRNVPREAVRDEKARLFGQATGIDVRADMPQITLSQDHHLATMRFRKRYSITGGESAREGEVLQELRWQQTPRGWKIVSERDLKVIR